MNTITVYLMLSTSYLRVNGNEIAHIYSALLLHFGGQNRVPPMVNNTYGGETEILLMEGSALFLNCSAHYHVKWMTSLILANKSRVQMGPKDNATNYFSINIYIKNISTSDDNSSVTCVPERVEKNSNFTLSTTIHLKVSNQNYKNEVNAIESSMTRITATNRWINIFLYVTLRRRPLFVKNLKSRWFKRFMSPVTGTEGGEITKLVEYSEIRWSATEPPDNEFNISGSLTAKQVPWIPLNQDLKTYVNFSDSARVRGGNYTVNITDDDGTVYYSKEFELVTLSRVAPTEIEIYDFNEKNMSDIIKNSFASILQERSVDIIANIDYNKTYLIVCQFTGHPVPAEYAFIYKNKFDCIPTKIDVKNGSLNQSLYSGPTVGLSADGTDCFDFTDYGSNLLLPIRTGNDGIILSALSTFTETVQVGCMYMPPNSSFEEKLYNEKTLLISDVQLHDTKTGLSATIKSPNWDEIIVGDNVTLRCIAERHRYPIIFWKLGEQYITDGDNPGPGYKIKLTMSSHAKYLDLIIFNISFNQSISYMCRAQRSMWSYMAERDTTVNVNVQVPQTPDFGPQTTNKKLIKVTKEKGAIEVYCDALGVPTPKIKWTKTEVGINCENEICQDNVTILSEDNKLLKVPQYDPSYSGLYDCIISNRLGTNKRQFRLEIVEPGQERVIILIVCLAIAALTALILATLAVRYYKRSKLTRPLKALLHELQQQAKNIYEDVKLDEALPTNEQTDVLPFDFRYEIAEGNYSLTNQLLGSGAFGQVHVGYLKLDDGRQIKVAVKSPIDGMNANQQRGLLSEMKLMMHLGRHINVLALMGVVTAQMTRGILCAILDFCEFGSLLDYVHQYGEPEKKVKRKLSGYRTIGYCKPIEQIENEGISNMDLLSFSYQIAVGMDFLSSKNIVHRDLALRNMLLTNQHIVKIADFGLALQAEKITDTEGYMPVKWMAIESMSFGVYTKESDAWSYGIVLWELFTFGKTPYPDFPQVNNQFLAWLKKGNRMTAPDNCPPQIASLLLSCWSECPKNRPSFSQCQQTVSMVGDEISSTYWNRFLKLLETIADDLAVSSYYNLNQIISIKREVNNIDILKDSNYTKVVSLNPSLGSDNYIPISI